MLPLTNLIVVELQRLKGNAKERELYKNIKYLMSSFDSKELSYSDFIKALMVLELRGIIRVESIKKGKRIIYLVKR